MELDFKENKTVLEDYYYPESGSHFHSIRTVTTIDLVKKYVVDSTENRILDVGCGKGRITMSLRQAFPLLKIDAFEIDQKMIEIASREIQGVNFFTADAFNYYPKDILYDAIILNNIYEHVDNPLRLLKNLKRLLKIDGILIISTPNRYHLKNLLRGLVGKAIKLSRNHVTEYSIGQLYDHHSYAEMEIIKLLAPRYKYEKFSLINFVTFRILVPVFDKYLGLVKSKNRLGTIVFIVSRAKYKK